MRRFMGIFKHCLVFTRKIPIDLHCNARHNDACMIIWDVFWRATYILSILGSACIQLWGLDKWIIQGNRHAIETRHGSPRTFIIIDCFILCVRADQM